MLLKRLLLILSLLVLSSNCNAQVSNSPLNIEEEDASPSTFPYKLKVTNGTLTDNGDGTASLSISGTGAPTTAHYVTTQAEAGLSAEFSLGSLTTGLLKHTVAAGVSTPATASEGTDYLAGTRIDDTKGNGDTTYVWSADKSFDQFALKAPLASPTFTGTVTMPNDTNQPGARHQWHISIVNPNAVVTASTIIPIVTLTDAAITVTKIVVSTDNAAREAAGDLKYADARIGLANATVVNDFDTTSGVRSDTTITSASIASGKFVYLSFDVAPSSSMTDMVIDVYWDYDS